MPPPPPGVPFVAPSSPSVAVVAEFCESSGFMSIGVTLGIALGLMFVGVIIGYAIGRRKALLAMLKQQAVMKQVQKAAGGDDDKDEEEDEQTPEDEADEVLQHFLNREGMPGLDDHPDTEVNRIFMHHIRKKQEELKTQKIIDTLIAAQNYEESFLDSLTPEARNKLGQQLLNEQSGPVTVASSVGSVLAWRPRQWGTDRNSTAILVEAGASMAPGLKAAQDGMDAAMKAAQELRDKQKQISKHLETHHEIDITVISTKGTKRSADGKRMKDALTVAEETKRKPFLALHEVMSLEERQIFAKRGRSRVAPPQDNRPPVGGDGGRRASAMGGLRRGSALQRKKETPPATPGRDAGLEA